MLPISRVVDQLILEWEAYQIKEKGHVKENERLRKKVNKLEIEVDNLKIYLDRVTSLDSDQPNQQKVGLDGLFEKGGKR